jgi:hypothetical protein
MTSNIEIVFELVIKIFNLDDKVIKSKEPGSLKPHMRKQFKDSRKHKGYDE